MKNIVGIDIGGMSLKAGRIPLNYFSHEDIIANKDLKLEDSLVINTYPQLSSQDFIDINIKAINKLKNDETIAIGIGSPGPLDIHKGVILESANLPLLKDVELITQLKKYYSLDNFTNHIFLQNDANCAALGQDYFGLGNKYQTYAVITLGTGIGGGLIFEKKLFNGFNGNGFEVGHTPGDFKSVLGDLPMFQCGCGNYGCLETIASTKGILNYFHHLSKNYFPKIQDVQTLYELLSHNDELTSAYIKAAFDLASMALGKLTATLIQTLNIDAIIFTGGISHAQEFLQPQIESFAQKNSFQQLYDRTKVIFTQGNENMGILGAGALAFSKMEKIY